MTSGPIGEAESEIESQRSPVLAGVGVKAGADGFPVMIPYWRLGAFGKT